MNCFIISLRSYLLIAAILYNLLKILTVTVFLGLFNVLNKDVLCSFTVTMIVLEAHHNCKLVMLIN